jgi:hypothetical protein
LTHEGRVAGARQSSLASGHRIMLASHLRSTLTDERTLLPAKLA